MRIFKIEKSYKREFKRQIRFAIAAAVGFSIAFAWREAIFNTIQNFVSRILEIAPEHFTTKIYTAITISILGVLIIFLTSKILKDRD